jgi:hypothetical protein
MHLTYLTTVEANGSFSTRVPTPGRYYFYPTSNYRNAIANNGEVVTVPPEGLSDFRMHVRPGVRVVLAADLDPLEQLVAVVLDEAGNEVVADELAQTCSIYLARGTYRWTLNRGAAIVSSGSFEVGDQPMTVVLRR